MATGTIDFTTGPSILPDVGILFYNGCTFSPLYESNISGRCVKDEAQRTVIYMEYTITVDGYVTMPAGAPDTSATMNNMRQILSKQGGELRYIGRGNDIEVNVPGGRTKDVKWGPIPEILEFQPLGGGRSAKVKWTVKVHIIEPGFDGFNKGRGGPPEGGGGGRGPDNPRRGRDLEGGAGGGPPGGGGFIKPGPAAAF